MPENDSFKTKDYVRRAKNNYRKKFDNVNASLPKGTADIIREKTGKSVNAYLVDLVRKDLKETYGIDIGE